MDSQYDGFLFLLIFAVIIAIVVARRIIVRRRLDRWLEQNRAHQNASQITHYSTTTTTFAPPTPVPAYDPYHTNPATIPSQPQYNGWQPPSNAVHVPPPQQYLPSQPQGYPPQPGYPPQAYPQQPQPSTYQYHQQHSSAQLENNSFATAPSAPSNLQDYVPTQPPSQYIGRGYEKQLDQEDPAPAYNQYA